MQSQPVAYTVIGLINTAIGFVLFVIWLKVLGEDLYNLAVPLAYCISVVIAFVLHRRFVFKVHGRVVRDFIAFVFVNSGGLLLNMALMYVSVSLLDIPPIPAQVLVLGTVALVSFFGHRYVSFRRPTDAPGSGPVLSETRG